MQPSSLCYDFVASLNDKKIWVQRDTHTDNMECLASTPHPPLYFSLYTRCPHPLGSLPPWLNRTLKRASVLLPDPSFHRWSHMAPASPTTQSRHGRTNRLDLDEEGSEDGPVKISSSILLYFIYQGTGSKLGSSIAFGKKLVPYSSKNKTFLWSKNSGFSFLTNKNRHRRSLKFITAANI